MSDKKHYSTHEYADLLKSHPDMKMVRQENYTVQGEDGTGYSYISGLDLDSVKDHALIVEDYLSAEVNDTKHQVGSAIVSVSEDDEGSSSSREVLLDRDQLIQLAFALNPIYKNHYFDYIGFEELDYSKCFSEPVTLLSSDLKVAMSGGFDPEYKKMTLKETILWLETNYKKEVEEMKLEY